MVRLACTLAFMLLTAITTALQAQNAAVVGSGADLDHFMMKSKDWTEAAKNFREQQYAKGNFNYKIAEETIKWLKSKV